MELITENFHETKTLGKKIGDNLKGGEIICINGDLGTGKTYLTKGIAQGLSIVDPIVSPTFTIVNEYSGRLKLYHFDVYRINDLDEIMNIGFDEYIFSPAVSVIEWADYIKELIPPDHIEIIIEKLPNLGDNFRKITINYIGDKFSYLKEVFK